MMSKSIFREHTRLLGCAEICLTPSVVVSDIILKSFPVILSDVYLRLFLKKSETSFPHSSASIPDCTSVFG